MTIRVKREAKGDKHLPCALDDLCVVFVLMIAIDT